jgi:hypothetical protein
MKNMFQQEAEQPVIDQMDKDLLRRQGVRTIQAKIAFNAEQHLPQDFISDIMHTHDNKGFAFCDPSSKKISGWQRFQLASTSAGQEMVMISCTKLAFQSGLL